MCLAVADVPPTPLRVCQGQSPELCARLSGPWREGCPHVCPGTPHPQVRIFQNFAEVYFFLKVRFP